MITKFKMFESMMSDQDIHKICKEYNLTGYDINPDGSISVDGNVYLGNRSLKRMPLVFKEVSGYFICHSNELISLEGCPGKVGGDFFCSNNRLKSLEGCPKEIPDDFYCEGNQLTSLEGGPEKIGGGFNCSSNKLTTLKGCPGIVGGNFNCGFNQLTSLEGCPRARVIYCYNNKITSFEGIPEFWEGHLDTRSNPVDEILQLFDLDLLHGDARPSGELILRHLINEFVDLINEFDVIQGNRVIRDRLEEVFIHLDMEIPKNIKLKEYILI